MLLLINQCAVQKVMNVFAPGFILNSTHQAVFTRKERQTSRLSPNEQCVPSLH